MSKVSPFARNLFCIVWLTGCAEPLCCILPIEVGPFKFVPGGVFFVALEKVFNVFGGLDKSSKKGTGGP